MRECIVRYLYGSDKSSALDAVRTDRMQKHAPLS